MIINGAVNSPIYLAVIALSIGAFGIGHRGRKLLNLPPLLVVGIYPYVAVSSLPSAYCVNL